MICQSIYDTLYYSIQCPDRDVCIHMTKYENITAYIYDKNDIFQFDKIIDRLLMAHSFFLII
jgi:hypothetical protein